MMNQLMRSHVILLLLLKTLSPWAQSSVAQMMTDQQLLSSGQELFMRHCSGCHGVEADGKGLAAPMLDPKPRNLLKGSFKFRSTPSGTLPTTADLIRTIDQGIFGASMPAFVFLGQAQKLALALYIKSLRKDWEANEGTSISLPGAPKEIFAKKAPFLLAAQRGAKIYTENCATCHGISGAGDGESAATLVDDDDQKIIPANYAKPYIKSGRSAQDIFKAISTGLDGTPMPAFGESFNEQQRWELVAFVMYQRGVGQGTYPSQKSLDQIVEEFSAKPTVPAASTKTKLKQR